MYNRELECLEQYPYTVMKMSRVRGGIWCQCEEGDFFLKEYSGSAKRINVLRRALSELEERGFAVDTPVLTAEGVEMGEDSFGKNYTLRKWYTGREIGVTNREEIRAGAGLLGQLRGALDAITVKMSGEIVFPTTYMQTIARQNRELKNISNFIGRKRRKNEFDMEFRRIFSKYYEQALKIAEMESVWGTSHTVRRGLCHRDYTHHNVLANGSKLAVVHFDNLGGDDVVADLALYMRKLLEKNQYQERMFQDILAEFEAFYPLTESERRQLYLRLAYPSRFLKIANHYATTRKNHIILRDLEKLDRLVKQEEERSHFLAFLEEFVV